MCQGEGEKDRNREMERDGIEREGEGEGERQTRERGGQAGNVLGYLQGFIPFPKLSSALGLCEGPSNKPPLCFIGFPFLVTTGGLNILSPSKF